MSHQSPITYYFNICKKEKKPPISYDDKGKENTKVENDNINDKDDELLKNFDLNWIFGPCSGLSRLDRWERASKLSLNPPQEIKELLLKNRNNFKYTLCIWDQNALLQPMACDSWTVNK